MVHAILGWFWLKKGKISVYLALLLFFACYYCVGFWVNVPGYELMASCGI